MHSMSASLSSRFLVLLPLCPLYLTFLIGCSHLHRHHVHQRLNRHDVAPVGRALRAMHVSQARPHRRGKLGMLPQQGSAVPSDSRANCQLGPRKIHIKC